MREVVAIETQGNLPVIFTAPEEMLPDYVRSFSYVAKDIVGGGISSEAWVHIVVRSPVYWDTIMMNQAPLAFNAHFAADQGQAVTGKLNATDDHDSIDQLRFSVVGLPGHGLLELSGDGDGAEFTYIPSEDFWGQVNFTFQVMDGMLLSSEGIVTIDVNHINAPPRPACEGAEAGLFSPEGGLLPALKMATTATRGDPAKTLGKSFVSLLQEERETAVAADPQRFLPKTPALERLEYHTLSDTVIQGSDAFHLACSQAGTFEAPMSSAASGDEAGLRFAILAFDRDAKDQMTYTILAPPTRGRMYASSIMLATGSSFSTETTSMDVGLLTLQVGEIFLLLLLTSFLLPLVSLPYPPADDSLYFLLSLSISLLIDRLAGYWVPTHPLSR